MTARDLTHSATLTVLSAASLARDVFVVASCYTDDSTLLSPSAYATRKGLGIFNKYAAEHGITFNATNSEYLEFTAHHKMSEDSNPLFSSAMNESNVGHILRLFQPATRSIQFVLYQ
jgi:hypothetical protein